jgi:hypothetical protein
MQLGFRWKRNTGILPKLSNWSRCFLSVHLFSDTLLRPFLHVTLHWNSHRYWARLHVPSQPSKYLVCSMRLVRGGGGGFPFYLTWWEPGTDTLLKLSHSGIPRKAVIENQKSFSSNSVAHLDTVNGLKIFLCGDALRSKGLICQPQLQHRQ